tara:strand:+ start:768 stop:959 length:192 start_codon:yes stop_codon:yes gene_type:complete
MPNTDEQVLKFILETPKKYSDRYKEVVPDGKAAVIGTLYVQRWYTESATELTVVISKGDNRNA